VRQPFVPLARVLAERAVRYVLIGVSGANMYAPAGGPIKETFDLVDAGARSPEVDSRTITRPHESLLTSRVRDRTASRWATRRSWRASTTSRRSAN
jgi:hypothetical protein